MKLLRRVRKPTLALPPAARRKLWWGPFLRSYSVVLFAYAAMYLIRKNFNIAQNDLIDRYGFTKTSLGVIGFWFSISYGIGKTVVGYFGDGRNTKNFIAILLILSSLAMAGFGLAAGSLTAMTLCYALNGFFQSGGGPSAYATIARWVPRTRRGTAFGAWNISHNLGGAMAATVAVFGAQVIFKGDLRGMFLFPAAVAFVIGVAGLFLGAESPEAYGLGSSEEIFEEEPAEEDRVIEGAELSKGQIFRRYVLGNPYIWALCFANVFVYIIRIGIDQWAVVYSREVLGFSNETARQGFTYFELGAILALFWGIMSDVARGRRALTSIAGLLLVLGLIPIYQHARTPAVYHLTMFALGFGVFGPQLLVGVATASFVPKSSVGVADGIKGTFGYLLGDSFSKIGLGMMADGKLTLFGHCGWQGTFSIIVLAAIAAIGFLGFVAWGEERKIRADRRRGKALAA